jgi:hypothetical protein
MSDTITFADDAERGFWEKVILAYSVNPRKEYCIHVDADEALRERRKRIGIPPVKVEMNIPADGIYWQGPLPEEVRRLLSPDPQILWEIHRRLDKIGAFEEEADAMRSLINSILAARKAVGLDAKEGT